HGDPGGVRAISRWLSAAIPPVSKSINTNRPRRGRSGIINPEIWDRIQFQPFQAFRSILLGMIASDGALPVWRCISEPPVARGRLPKMQLTLPAMQTTASRSAHEPKAKPPFSTHVGLRPGSASLSNQRAGERDPPRRQCLAEIHPNPQ